MRDEMAKRGQGDRGIGKTRYERLMQFLRVQELFVRADLCPTNSSCPEDVVISPSRSFIERIAGIGEDGIIPEKSLFGRQRYIDLRQLIHDEAMLRTFRGGIYIKQYLAPWDPHGVIFPTGSVIDRLILDRGKALPLLFMKGGDVQNERLSAFLKSDWGPLITMMMVGSFLVKSVNTIGEIGRHYNRCEPFGYFWMGSSILLLFPKGCTELLCAEGMKVECGAPLVRFVSVKSVA
jgi:phosphatidylserine decarboxylase